MSFLDVLKPEYIKHLSVLSEDERFAVEHYYGLNGRPRLNLAGLAELRRAPGVSDIEARSLLSSALRKLQDATQSAEHTR